MNAATAALLASLEPRKATNAWHVSEQDQKRTEMRKMTALLLNNGDEPTAVYVKRATEPFTITAATFNLARRNR